MRGFQRKKAQRRIVLIQATTVRWAEEAYLMTETANWLKMAMLKHTMTQRPAIRGLAAIS